MAEKTPEFVRVNYLRQRREFDKIASTNILSRLAEVLYSRLFYLFNEHGQADLWQKSMQLKNKHVAGLVAIDVSTLDRVRRELVDNKLIKYTPGVGSASGNYELVILYNTLLDEDSEPAPRQERQPSPTAPRQERQPSPTAPRQERQPSPTATALMPRSQERQPNPTPPAPRQERQPNPTPPAPYQLPPLNLSPRPSRFVGGLSSDLPRNLFRTDTIQKDLYIFKPSESENPPASSDLIQKFMQEFFSDYDTGTLKSFADNCFRYYSASGWVDSTGRPVVNWKAKAISWVYRENGTTCGSVPRGSPNQKSSSPTHTFSRNYSKEQWDSLIDDIYEKWI